MIGAEGKRTMDEREQVENLAYRFWLQRGRPIGSPDVDWFHAEDELGRARLTSDLPLSAYATEPTEE
jgi:hypothetical protein